MFKDKRCIEGTVMFMPDGPVITTASTPQTSTGPMQSITETISDFASMLPKLQSAMNMLPNFSPNSSPKISSVSEQTPMYLINELARYNDIEYTYYLIKEDGPAHQKRFTIALQLDNEEYIADSTSIKKAQHAAAAKALSNTKFPQPSKVRGKNSLPSFGDGGNNDHCQLGNEYANMIDRNIGKSPISVVYEIGAAKKINVAFEVISTTGPNHALVFGTRCSFGHLVADGTGSSKKKSKSDAAQKMLLLLRMQPDQCIDESTQQTKRKRNKRRRKKKKNQHLVKLNTENPNVSFNGLHQIQQLMKKMEPRLSSLGDYSITNGGTASSKNQQSIAQSIKSSSKMEHPSNRIKHSKPKAIDDKIETPRGNGNPLLPDMLNIGDQLNGKLNLNMDMYQTLAKQFLNADIEKAAGSLLRNMNTNNLKQPQLSPSATRETFKEELLYMTDLIDVEVKFSDFPTASNSMYTSLVSIGTKPGRVCIGEGPNKEMSQEKAAAEALFDLSEQGLDNIIARQG
ncbi:staufen [Carabus blaptoides fortunei]